MSLQFDFSLKTAEILFKHIRTNSSFGLGNGKLEPLVPHYKRVLKGVNGSWDLPIFLLGKWDFMHWDCRDSSTKKQ